MCLKDTSNYKLETNITISPSYFQNHNISTFHSYEHNYMITLQLILNFKSSKFTNLNNIVINRCYNIVINRCYN